MQAHGALPGRDSAEPSQIDVVTPFNIPAGTDALPGDPTARPDRRPRARTGDRAPGPATQTREGEEPGYTPACSPGRASTSGASSGRLRLGKGTLQRGVMGRTALPQQGDPVAVSSV